MHGHRGVAIAAHDDRVFPIELDIRNDLVQWNHSPSKWTPNLHAANDVDIAALREGRSGDDGQESRFLRKDASALAAWLAIKPYDAAFKAKLQGLGNFDPRDAVP